MFVKKYQFIEFPITASYAPLKFQLTDIQYLRGVQILSIEAFAAEDIPNSPTQQPVCTLAQLEKMFLTLYTSNPDKVEVNDKGTVIGSGQTQAIQRIPLVRLRNMDTGSTGQPHIRQIFQMVGQTVYWEQCYVELGSTLGNGSSVNLCLGVTFQGTANS